MTANVIKPRVIEVDADQGAATRQFESAPPVVPKLVETERTERVKST